MHVFVWQAQDHQNPSPSSNHESAGRDAANHWDASCVNLRAKGRSSPHGLRLHHIRRGLSAYIPSAALQSSLTGSATRDWTYLTRRREDQTFLSQRAQHAACCFALSLAPQALLPFSSLGVPSPLTAPSSPTRDPSASAAITRSPRMGRAASPRRCPSTQTHR